MTWGLMIVIATGFISWRDLTAVHYFDNGYVAMQCLQKNMDSCTACLNITESGMILEMILKTALNTIQSINHPH